MKILVLVAHPDDESIMCGATIDKLVKKGHSVSVSYYTQNCQAFFAKETQEQRKKRAASEAKACAKVLGFTGNFLPFHDMEVEKNKGILIQKTIEEIRRVEPDVIITHHSDDKHIDHRTLGEIVPEANFQSGCNLCGGTKSWKAAVVLQGEINLEMTMPFNFQIVSAISQKNLKRKIEAFKCYESVNDEHGTDTDWLYTRLEYAARLRGGASNEMYGEAFIINNYAPANAVSLSLLTKILEK